MNDELFLIIAHRGASAYALENSFEAFKKAIELKAPMIETDIQESLDGHLVLMHDGNLDRTTRSKGAIKSMTVDQIKSIKLRNNEEIPLLDDVLKQLGEKVRFNLEIKVDNVEKKVNDLLNQYQLVEKTMISSFSFTTLKNLHDLNSHLHLAIITFLPWTVFRVKYSFKKLQTSGIEAINPNARVLSKSLVEQAHAQNFKVYPWTVDTKTEILKLRDEYQIDGIVTNVPDILSKA